MLKDKLVKLFIVLTFTLTGTTVTCVATKVVPFSDGNVAVPPSAPVSKTNVGSESPSGGEYSLQAMKAKIDEIINPPKDKVEQREDPSTSNSSSPTASGLCGTNCTWSFYEGNSTLTIAGSGAMDEYSQAGSNGMPWNTYENAIKSVTIENGITSISERAFYNCSQLTSVTLTGNNAVNCFTAESFPLDKIISVTLGNSIKVNVQSDTFKNCKNLTTVTLNNKTALNKFTSLFPCAQITSVTLNNIDSIPAFAFQGCSSLQSIEIPDSVTKIGIEAFQGCSALRSIEIPDSVTKIEEGAFQGCRSLTSIKIPNSITAIGSSMFAGCKSLTSINIPNNITSIGDHAFYECSSLTSIEIPDTVEFIGNGTFAYSGLTSIEIPESVTSIGTATFKGCHSLTSIKIPNSVTSIGELAFLSCTSLASINIPNSVKSIEPEAFNKCTSLSSVIFGNNIDYIGQGVFYACNNLTSVTVNNDYTVSQLSSLVCSDGILGAYTQIQKVILGNNVTAIDPEAFADCTNLTSIEIPKTVRFIGGEAFANCSSLSHVVYLGTADPGKNSTNVFDEHSKLANVTVTESYQDEVFCGKPVSKREIAVEIKIDDGVKVDEINTDDLIRIICETGIPEDAISIDVKTDDQNNVVSVLVYVNDRSTADKIVVQVNEKTKQCESTSESA